MPIRSPQSIWETALGQLELQVTRPNFETWLRPTTGLRMEHGRLVVGVPSDFALEWLRTRLTPLADRVLSRLLGNSSATVTFEVLGAQPGTAPAVEMSTATPRKPDAKGAGLDTSHTFDSFVVLKCNRIPYQTALKTAAGAEGYGLLVLQGASGTGKTHLLHAIGNQAIQGSQRVIALTGEGFVDRYGTAVREGRPHTFRQAFSPCDLLLLDDLAFLAARPASQEQFLHLFNALRQERCTIVVTTHLPLERVPGITDRLKTRLGAALSVQLSLPGAKERVAFVQARVAQQRVSISDETIAVLAESGRATFAELDAALRQVIGLAHLEGVSPSPELARAALSEDAWLQSPARPAAETIIDTVARHFSLSTDQLTGPARSRQVAYARHIAAYLLRELGGHAVTQIGILLGGRDHSTVLSAYKRIARERSSLPETAADIEAVLAELRPAVVA